VYEERQVPYTEPKYETKQVPYEVPIYENKQVPYEYSYSIVEQQPYTVKEYVNKQVPVEPRVTSSKKIAVIPFSGVTPTTTWQAIANFQLGFDRTEDTLVYAANPLRQIEFIPRISLISVLTETQLIDLGPSAIKTLKDKFGVDWICTASILQASGYNLELQIVDTEGKPILSGQEVVFFGSSWEDIGKQVATYLLAPRSKIEQVLEDVTKNRSVTVPKTETRYKEERLQTGSETRYKSEKVQIGTETKYRTEEVKIGTKQKPVWSLAGPGIGTAVGVLTGVIISGSLNGWEDVGNGAKGIGIFAGIGGVLGLFLTMGLD